MENLIEYIEAQITKCQKSHFENPNNEIWQGYMKAKIDALEDVLREANIEKQKMLDND